VNIVPKQSKKAYFTSTSEHYISCKIFKRMFKKCGVLAEKALRNAAVGTNSKKNNLDSGNIII